LNIFIKAIPYTFRSTSTFPPIEFYRVVKVQKEKDCDIKRLFHIPYNLRSKISTSRYSIAGYPCLYLGTSLDLCCEELNVKPLKSEAFVSKLTFKHIVPNTIKVIDLAIKPQDFLNFGKSFGMVDYKKRRFVRLGHLTPDEIFVHYLLWYPLLAACSYIRNDRTANFSAEYIVSQVLMQWLSNYNKQFKNELFGLRYFSCASKSASEKGFNYVFPTSGKSISSDLRFCPILSQCFELTKPRDLRKYRSLEELEQDLDNDKELFSIYDYLPLYIDE
ncbi:MAG: hypothetical protein K2K50_07390, partial [Anaeroplasmataceae bacterium]|nr:hypothetical protein [Anaeroplasmataceae bacterium]